MASVRGSSTKKEKEGNKTFSGTGFSRRPVSSSAAAQWCVYIQPGTGQIERELFREKAGGGGSPVDQHS